MELNLWTFLTLTILASLGFLSILIFQINKQKIKQLEVEAIKAEKANLEAIVNDALDKKLAAFKGRLEVLEAVVTDKNYELHEKITRLK
uniref:hypothetical protein n=1 Tax=Ningiella ruwaisensis TaxID=2364274 RepID=UPI0010A08182|nr:hypothetical protein [Ningiella ruwaisensis]